MGTITINSLSITSNGATSGTFNLSEATWSSIPDAASPLTSLAESKTVPIDYNETVKECCIREIKEETGVDVSYTLIEDNLGYNDDPNETRQNVTFRFIFYSSTYFTQRFDTSNSEPDEVEEVKWIKLDEIDNYQFAFNHENLIKEAASKIF